MQVLDQPTSIKGINQLRILNLLRLHPGISRAELARQTGLGKATISTIVAELIGSGVICEAKEHMQRASVGRRPVGLRLEKHAGYAVGIELTGGDCIAVLCDLYADPLRSVRYPMREHAVRAAVDLMVGCVDELLAGADETRLLGVAVGVPGPVSSDRKRVIQAENQGWFDVDLGTPLAERLGKPVTIVKRQAAGALGEYWYGIGAMQPNLLYVSIGVGIGCGIIAKGELYEGTGGTAGEVGHIIVVPNGHRCNCGNYGCLETLASNAAIVVRAREKAKEGVRTVLSEWTQGALQSVSSRMVIDAASQGDSLAVEVIREAGLYLGIALANVINLFNPSMIIVGGDMVELGDLFLDPVREAVQRNTFALSYRDVRITPGALGYRAAAIGAATLVIDRFFGAVDPAHPAALHASA